MNAGASQDLLVMDTGVKVGPCCNNSFYVICYFRINNLLRCKRRIREKV